MDSPAVPGARWVWVVFMLAVVGGSVSIVQYALLDTTASRLGVPSALHYALLVAHISTAMIALLLGPLQFVPAIRARRRRHRRIGRAYLLVGVIPSGLFAIPVALLSERLITQVGLLIPAVGWLVTAWLAVRAIRHRDIEGHRAWMTRNYALTFLAVTARILVPLMVLAQLPFTGETFRAAADSAPSIIPIGQVLGWVVNLVIAEIVIRRRRALAHRHTPHISPRSAGWQHQRTL
jgi:uncharacterized membrane protein YozB (DUF420 family)